MAELIDRADPHDPIARQFVPDPAELDVTPEERADPIGDHAHSPVEGIVHRYPDRVLLKLTHVCAVYCRFCFRREMIGPAAEPLTPKQLDAALGYIAAHPEIWEVVLTGGDPLVLSARRLKQVVSRLAAIAARQGDPRAHAACRSPIRRASRRSSSARSRPRARRPTSCCTPTMRAN